MRETANVTEGEEFWIPLVDEPIGELVAQIQTDDAEITHLVNSPHKMLAFRTLAYIRVGVLLGQLLVEHELPDPVSDETWVDVMMRDPTYHERVVALVRKTAEEIAADSSYADEEPIGPDEEVRERFREFARRQFG